MEQASTISAAILFSEWDADSPCSSAAHRLTHRSSSDHVSTTKSTTQPCLLGRCPRPHRPTPRSPYRRRAGARRSTTATILAITAGSPPAAAKLASVLWIGPYRRRKSRRATCRSLLHPDATILGLQQTDRGSRFCPTSSTPAPRLNPNSARRTAAELPTAISCLGAFPTPAARACGLIRDCRRPKTCTTPEVDHYGRGSAVMGLLQPVTSPRNATW
jgi:hypothetical protein